MKKLKLLLFLLCFMALGISGFSQVSTHYIYSATTSAYTEITGGTVHVTGTFDDANYTAVPIGFSFTFNGAAYTTLGINTNGFVWFGTTDPATNDYSPLSSSTAMSGVVAPFGRDLVNVDAASTIRSELLGSSPNQIFVIQWKAAKRYLSTGENINFQIRLYETTNKIEFVYGSFVGGTSTSYPQVGLRGSANTDYYNRTTTSNWSATTGGSSNTATCLVSSTVVPANGTTFVYTPATCISPSALTATGITTTSATLGWTAGGSETTWHIEYGPAGFDLGTGTKVYTSTNPKTISGLTAATSYSFYVKGICSASDSSGYAGPYSFVTSCNTIVSFPWTEGFEGLSTVGSNILPVCWAYTNISKYNYSCNGTCNSNTAHSGTKFIGGDWNFDVWNFTPAFQLNAGTSYDISYWFKCTNATVGYNVTLMYGSTQDVAGMTNTINAETGLNISTWTLRKFSFTPSTTGVYYFGLHNVCPNSSPNGIAFDDFKLDLTPSCVVPSALTATGITNNSAQLGWTAGGSETNWHIQYGPSGFALGTGTKVYTNSNPTTINGLSASTSYQFYVKAICSASDSSAYEGPFSFTTLCDNVTVFPFTESFDGTTFAPICWGNTKTAGTGNLWQRSTAGSYPTCSPHSGAGMAFFNSYYAAGTRVELVSPALNLPNDNYRVSFWMYRDAGYSSNADSVAVYYSATNSTVGATKLLRINRSLSLAPVESVAGWYKYTANLPAGSGGIGRYIIFEGVSSAGNNIYVDDVVVEAIPSCNAPTSPVATNITSTSADLGWTVTGSETAWQIEIGNSPMTPGAGFKVVTTNNPTIIPNGTLSPNTLYDFRVRAICAPGDTSSWTSITTFRTICSSVSVFPITESFDGTTFAPNCWSNIQVSGTGLWDRTTSGSYPTCTPHSGAGMAYFNSYNFSNSTAANLITVPFDLPSDLYRVSFWMYRDAEYSSKYDSLTVYYNTTSSLTGATRLLNVNRYIGFSPVETGADGWYKYTANMPAGSTGNGRYIIFKATSGYGNDIYLDDVTIEAQPTCNVPTLLTVANITTTSAQLSWTTGGATLWNIEYGTTGFTPGTGTIKHNVTNPYTLNGLVAGTTYDFYVQDSCSASDVSTWAGPKSFTTECLVNTTYPWLETFEGTVFPPLCWSIVAQNISASWIKTTYSAHSPTHSAGVPWDYSQDENLITPAFNFASLSHPIFEFWYETSAYDPSTFNIVLWVSTDGGSTWPTQIWDKNSEDINSGVWTKKNIDLTSYAGQTNMKFKFEYIGNDGDNFLLDDVGIKEGADLAITFPKNTYQLCGLTSTNPVQLHIKNVGTKQINTGEKMYTYYKVDALPLVKDSLTLSANLVPNDSVVFTFTTPVDFSAYQQYHYITYLSYYDDVRYANDTTKGIVEHVNFSYNPWATDTIHVSSFPYVLKAGFGYNCYAWNNGACVADDSIHNINSSGWQKVRVNKYENCHGVDSVYINLVTGIEDNFSFGNLAIFPNPTTGKITVNISGIDEKVKLSVVTIQGQEIYADEFYTMYSGTSRQIDLSSYPKGIYFIKVANDKSVNVKKVVVD